MKRWHGGVLMGVGLATALCGQLVALLDLDGRGHLGEAGLAVGLTAFLLGVYGSGRNSN